MADSFAAWLRPTYIVQLRFMARKKDTTENACVMEMFVTKAAVISTDVPVAE
jgi:hypothetical protein